MHVQYFCCVHVYIFTLFPSFPFTTRYTYHFCVYLLLKLSKFLYHMTDIRSELLVRKTTHFEQSVNSKVVRTLLKVQIVNSIARGKGAEG